MRWANVAGLALAACGADGKRGDSPGCSDVAAVVDGTWIDGAGCELADPLAAHCDGIASETWEVCPSLDDVLDAIGGPTGTYEVVVESCDAERTRICWSIPPDGEGCAVFDGDGAVAQVQLWGTVLGASSYTVCCDGHMISPEPVFGDPGARCYNPRPYGS